MIKQKNKLRKLALTKRKSFAGAILFFILVLLLTGFLIVSNIKIKERRQEAQKKIEIMSQEVEKLKLENLELKAKLAQRANLEFIEREAREKYNLKKPGEEVVVIIKEKAPQVPAAPPVKNFWQRFLEFLRLRW